MRILWICNIMLPAFARLHSLPFSNREGWLTGCYEQLKQMKDITLGIAFPAPRGYCWKDPGLNEGGNDAGPTVRFYGFTEDLIHPERYDSSLEVQLSEIIGDFRPELVHIFGTEFPHALAAVRVWAKPERTLVSLQGICSDIAEEYMGGLPEQVQKSVTFRDLVKRDSLKRQQEKLRIRGKRETELLRDICHVAGRTDYDREHALGINGKLRYHRLCETMRPEFYSGAWTTPADVGNEQRIFITQGDVPYKGLHLMLEALKLVKERYPGVRLYIAGNSVVGDASAKSRIPLPLRIGAYGRYLRKLMSGLGLREQVTVLGQLTAQEMKEQYLCCSVFVCPSFVENSPNSLAEAMLLGVPSIAARVGGIPSMAQEGSEALFFDRGNARELAEKIMSLLSDREQARKLGAAARARALVQHDPERNLSDLIGLYRELYSSNEVT